MGANLSLSCTSSGTFRLASYSVGRMQETISRNLDCLQRILYFNKKNSISFFRITSNLIPFASHVINAYPWQDEFKDDFARIGEFIRENDMRVGMHPGQYSLLNALDQSIVDNSIAEIGYHADVLDLMGLDSTAKIQIHVGGAYGDKSAAIQRFIENYAKAPEKIKKRLVIENDERLYTVADCLKINTTTGIPVLLDILHHELNNNGESIGEVLIQAATTWRESDGKPIIDYADQDPEKRRGAHAFGIDAHKFEKFLEIIKTTNRDIDIMLESKGKEKTALEAMAVLDSSLLVDSRLRGNDRGDNRNSKRRI